MGLVSLLVCKTSDRMRKSVLVSSIPTAPLHNIDRHGKDNIKI